MQAEICLERGQVLREGLRRHASLDQEGRPGRQNPPLWHQLWLDPFLPAEGVPVEQLRLVVGPRCRGQGRPLQGGHTGASQRQAPGRFIGCVGMLKAAIT